MEKEQEEQQMMTSQEGGVAPQQRRAFRKRDANPDPRSDRGAELGYRENGPGDVREPACDPNEQRSWRASVST
mgnify:CR=1 FL=1